MELPTPYSCEFHRKQRDEPSVTDVHAALEGGGTGRDAMPARRGNVLASPRRTTELGRSATHASPWRSQKFELSTPYPIATPDSPFTDAAADAAALEAVARSAGLVTAAPAAGMTTNKHNTLGHLPSMRKSMMQR